MKDPLQSENHLLKEKETNAYKYFNENRLVC